MLYNTSTMTYMDPLIVFLIAFIPTVLAIPAIIKISHKTGILDSPRSNSVHTEPVPMLGGLILFVVFFCSAVFLRVTDGLMPLLIGSLIMIISGLYDDLRGMNAAQKLSIQFIAALIVIFFGLGIDKITVPFGPVIELGPFSGAVTILWFIFMINLINIIDGLDGLAAGLSLVTLLTLLHFLWPVPVRAQVLILIAALSGFLIFNFHPAKIFLGNNGSAFLGFAIAFFSLTLSQKSTVIPILALPCCVLGVHVVDVIYAFTRRKKRGASIFEGDKRHIHHVMLKSVKSHRLTVLLFYLFSLIIAFMLIKTVY